MAISAAKVKELRDLTAAPMLDVKKALEAANGDLDKAREWLNERGLARAAKKADRDTSEGRVHSYIHTGGRVGVMVEVNCETDFVARGEDFGQLCHDLCLHIAMADPTYLTRDEIPEDVIADKRQRFAAAAMEEGKPANIAEKIAEGRLAKWYGEEVLMDQPFIKDEDQTIDRLLKQYIGTLGENMRIRRYARFELGSH